MDTNWNIRDIAKLLKDPNEVEDSSDDDLPPCGIARLGPGDIGQKVKVKVRGNQATGDAKEEEEPEDPDAIWSLSEVPQVPYSDDAAFDPRERPEYDLKYKQAVTTQDIFLQMGNKTPMTSSCESMVVTMKLLGERMKDIDCHIMSQHLDIRSPRYRLSLPLPHPVDPDLCGADWDTSTDVLTVNLLLNRELDYVNF